MVALHDRRSFRLAQQRHRPFEVEFSHRCARVVAGGFADLRHGFGLLIDDIRIAIAEQLFAALSRMHEPAIRRDAVQPRRKTRLLAKRLQIAPRLYERFLRQVVRERGIAGC